MGFKIQIDSDQLGNTMPMRTVGPVVPIDPVKKEIFDAIGDLSQQHLFSARVLVATYVRPEKTKGGVYLTNKEQMEDIYQGSVGLVLKKGPMAFKDDGESTFHGQGVEVGEWVVFRPGDGKRIQINNINCRIVDDTQIDMVVTDPMLITHRPVDARVK
jgi:co-chaperonin GroES (HSP10)